MFDGPSDADVTRALLYAEQEVRLIDRVAPQNLVEERARLLRALSRNERAEPRLVYSPAPDLSELRARLTLLAVLLEDRGALAGLYGARALELEREAAMVEAVGTKQFRSLARARFAHEELGTEEVRALVGCWVLAEDDETEEGLVASDDEAHPESLVSVLRARIGASRKAVRVELRPRLATIAAAGEDIVLVRPGVRLSPKRALRIALHELEAHVFPRGAAQREPIGILRAGAPRSAEHEEGRALLIEERAGLLDAARRRELALRHLAASAIQAGATLTEAVRGLTEQDAPLELSLEVALRALRGGGLAREVVYLPAYLSVKRAFAERPEIEHWFERGRASLECARVFESLRANRAGGSLEASGPISLLL